MRCARCVILSTVLAGCAVLVGGLFAAEDAAKPRPAITSLPRIPATVHDALQRGDYPSAITLIQGLLNEKSPPAPDYLLYLLGRAYHEMDKHDDAIRTYQKLEKDHPQGAWVSRARFGRAASLARQRNYEAAGDIYRQEADRLLSTGRRDELTAIYLEYADRFFEGEPKPEPSQHRQPDYAQALVYYQQALELKPGLALRQKIELRIARCHQELAQLPQAIEAYTSYLQRYAGPRTKRDERMSVDVEAEVRFRLGQSQLAASQPAEARKTWQDFLTGDAAKEAKSKYVAEATYRLAHTYGIPAPGTIGDMELGIAALERFVKAYPDHELAPQAELEIAQSYLHHGRHEPAVARLRLLIENKRYEKSPQLATAWHLLGQSYLAQGEFDKALAAWRAFLEKFPTDPRWSDVQRGIVDAEYAQAAAEQQAEHFAEARRLWETFLNKYPLDPRAPQILFQFGAMRLQEANAKLTAERKADQPKGKAAAPIDRAKPRELSPEVKQLLLAAIDDWQRLVSKYPDNPFASQAALLIGTTYEDYLLQLTEALETYKKVTGPHQPAAQQRIVQLTAKSLEVVTERKFRSDESPRVQLAVRNIESVTLKLYRIDLTDYFRKMHLASQVEALDVALIDPDRTWEYKLENYEPYRRLSQPVDVPVKGPGVWVLTVASETLEATTMVVVSDLELIVKSSRNELFVFVQNSRQQQPVAGATLLISDGARIFAEEQTGKDGVLQKKYDELKTLKDLRVFATHETHAASSAISLEGLEFAVGLSPKGYIYTDRPAYRASQLVHIKGLIRWVAQDHFVFKAGEKYQLDVYDSRSRVIRSTSVTLDEFGGFADHFTLPEAVPEGACRIHVFQPGREQSYESQFAVHEYQLEPVRLQIDLPQKVYYRGEHITGKITLKYYYGTPLAGRTIQYRLADDRVYTAQTDAAGEIAFDLPTQRYSESQPLVLSATYAERNLRAAESAWLATRGFEIALSTLRNVYIAGETFDLTAKTTDAGGKPLAVPLVLHVLEQTEDRGKTGEREVRKSEFTTDAASGEGRQTLKLDRGARYTLRVEGTDRFGNPVSASWPLLVSGDEDRVRLRILADKHHYKAGDKADIGLNWREKPALALVTFEGAEILGYRIVELKTGVNALPVEFAPHLAPNFELSVAVMEANRFHEARAPFKVARELKLTIKPSQTTLEPGQELKVELTAADALGNPVAAELTLGLIQKSLLDAFPDALPAIDDFFNGQARQVSMRSRSSCTFRYAPRTRPINDLLLAEADREAVRAAENAARAMVAQQADKVLSLQIEQTQTVMENEAMDGDAVALEDISGLSYAANGGYGSLDGVNFDNDGAKDDVLNLDELRAQGNVAGSLGTMEFNSNLQKPLQEGRAAGRAGNQRGQPFGGGAGGAGTGMGGGSRGTNWGMNQSLPQSLSALQLDQKSNKAHDSREGLLRSHARQPRNDYYSTQAGDASLLGRQLEEVAQRDGTIVSLNSWGEFQAINGMSVAELQNMAKVGFEVLPAMAQAETGYWSPVIVTDDKGHAQVTFRLPDRSTAWVLRTRGIDRETRAGSEQAEITARKRLFGEMKLPPAFVIGDKVQVLIEVHHLDDQAGEISVRFQSRIGEKTTEVTRTIKAGAAGIDELSVPVEIIAGTKAEFELTVTAGKLRDVSRREVMIKPNGVPVYATKSGTASQNTTVIIAAPPGLAADNQSLELIIGPTINRTLLDAVLGTADHETFLSRLGSLQHNPLETALTDVLGGVGLLRMLGQTRGSSSPEALALGGRIQAALATLTSSQRDDGGWSWTGTTKTGEADRYLTSRAVWALSAARRAGFAVSPDTLQKAIQNLNTRFAASAETDLEGKAILLHGLAEAGAADFAHANRLHRSRSNLSASGLLHVCLALVRLDRKPMAKELLDLAQSKMTTTLPAAAEVDASLAGCVPWMQSGVELRALNLLAVNELDAGSPRGRELSDWLFAARTGSHWLPEKANGPAVLALSEWAARSKFASEKYALTVYANQKLVTKLTIEPAQSSTRTIAIPRQLLSADQPQKLNLDIEGRGTFSYSAVLSGYVPPAKVQSVKNNWDFERWYQPNQRYLDGQPIPRGFDPLTGSYNTFRNPLTQLPLGERGDVNIRVWRHNWTGGPDEQLDYLVLTEPIPAGVSILTDSIVGGFERYEIQPGAITFYLGSRPSFNDIHFSVAGYLPGDFQNPPTTLRSFYQPERLAVARGLPLSVLARGKSSGDAYRLTPQELLEFGKRLAAKGDYAAAAGHLSELFKTYRLKDEIYKEVVQLLFQAALAAENHGDIVQYFEILKEKYPDAEVAFADILKVGRAYKELGEYERSYLVYRATAEASFQRESQIAGFLDEHGEFLRSVQTMERLFREYPAEGYIATATYALAQEVYGKAVEAAKDVKLRQARVTRVDLIHASIHMLDHFLSTWSTDPAADQASFSLLNALLDLEEYQPAIDRAKKYVQRFPDSKLLDSFWYVVGFSEFALGRDEAALQTARKVAEMTRTDPDTGVEVAAANKWQAIYIMGQIHHSLGQPAQAITEYERVKDRFADAAEAIDFFTHKGLTLPEVTTVKTGDPAKLTLKFRNVADVTLKVYRIDLMKFGLLQRNLSRITSINLAGIHAYHDASVALGNGKDYAEREQELDLPLKEEGAYLVVCQGANLHTSGLVLVTPLTLQVQEDEAEPTHQRVRVTVRNTLTEKYVPNVEVKAIGSSNSQFVSGRTDLRGVFVADGIEGTTTIMARGAANQYAFYRGKAHIGRRPNEEPAAQQQQQPSKPFSNEQLLENVRGSNTTINGEQRSNYKNLIRNQQKGVQFKQAF